MPVELHIFDVLTALASLGVKFIGFPAQIRAGRQRRPGLVWQLAAGMCASYLLWVVHGVMHHDWVEIISQGAGVITTAVLLVQALRPSAPSGSGSCPSPPQIPGP